jgi:hypothetical protein
MQESCTKPSYAATAVRMKSSRTERDPDSSYFQSMTYEPLNQCCRYVGWASAMMTFAGMGSFALVGIAADFLR